MDKVVLQLFTLQTEFPKQFTICDNGKQGSLGWEPLTICQKGGKAETVLQNVHL